MYMCVSVKYRTCHCKKKIWKNVDGRVNAQKYVSKEKQKWKWVSALIEELRTYINIDYVDYGCFILSWK